MRWRVKSFFFTNVLLILVITLFPFNFSLTERLSIQEIITGFTNNSNPEDFFTNILLFVPFGFCLAWLINVRGIRELVGIAIIFITSLGFSTIIEFLQLFLERRFSTQSDIVANSLGGLLGGVLFSLFYLSILISPSKRYEILSPKRLLFLFVGYFTFVTCITLSLFDTTTLSNWNRSFPLIVGNEATGDRPWQGYVSQLAIFDRVLTKENIEQFLTKGNFTVESQNSLLADYQLFGKENYSDRLKLLPDLSWQGDLAPKYRKQSVKTLAAGSVSLTANRWLQTLISPSLLTERVSKTSQFTVCTTVSTKESEQIGPARIVSLSKNPTLRNFTLAQQNANLVFRVRNLLMGKNGANFEFLLPNAFTNTDYHRIAASYGNSKLKIYFDRASNFRTWKLMPEANLFQHLFSTNSNYRAMIGYKLLYYLVVFAPLGFLLGLLSLAFRGRFENYSFFWWGATIAPIVILQSLLAYGNKTSLNPNDCFLSFAIVIITFFLAKNEIIFQN